MSCEQGDAGNPLKDALDPVSPLLAAASTVVIAVAAHSWKKTGKVGTRGGIIAKVTFKAYQKEYSVADADKRFTFVQKQDGVKL